MKNIFNFTLFCINWILHEYWLLVFVWILFSLVVMMWNFFLLRMFISVYPKFSHNLIVVSKYFFFVFFYFFLKLISSYLAVIYFLFLLMIMCLKIMSKLIKNRYWVFIPFLLQLIFISFFFFVYGLICFNSMKCMLCFSKDFVTVGGTNHSCLKCQEKMKLLYSVYSNNWEPVALSGYCDSCLKMYFPGYEALLMGGSNNDCEGCQVKLKWLKYVGFETLNFSGYCVNCLQDAGHPFGTIYNPGIKIYCNCTTEFCYSNLHLAGMKPSYSWYEGFSKKHLIFEGILVLSINILLGVLYSEENPKPGDSEID